MNTESYAQINARFKRLHVIWSNMKYRCYGHRNSARTEKHYKSKGISVCDEWVNNFAAFYDWAVTHGYEDDLTIDRIDPSGNYCPENCRWISWSENASRARQSNTANLTVLYSARKRLGLTQGEIAEQIGVDQSSISFWETGKCSPNVRLIPKVARAYQISVDEVISATEKSVERQQSDNPDRNEMILHDD